jgi:hypothetical protein
MVEVGAKNPGEEMDEEEEEEEEEEQGGYRRDVVGW